MANVGGYVRPTAGTFISDTFRGHQNRRPPSGEPGVDYGVAYGTTLVAVESGRVSDLSRSAAGGTGRFLTIDLDDGYRTRSLHLSRIDVNVGDRVQRGQAVGKTGASAWGKDWGVGAHVHQSLFPVHSYAWARLVDFERFVGPDNDGGTVGRAGYADNSPELIEFQKKLQKMGHDLGPTGADGKWTKGGYTYKATLHEQQMAEKNGYPGGNVVDDGIPGPSTNSYLDWWLVGRHQVAPPGGHTATVWDAATIGNVEGLQKIARLYLAQKVDNQWGAKSATGLQLFLDRSYKGSLAQWLRVKYGYVGNDIWGPVMKAALQRANEANRRAL